MSLLNRQMIKRQKQRLTSMLQCTTSRSPAILVPKAFVTIGLCASMYALCGQTVYAADTIVPLKDKQVQDIHDQEVTYWDGDRQVTVHLALDELEIPAPENESMKALIQSSPHLQLKDNRLLADTAPVAYADFVEQAGDNARSVVYDADDRHSLRQIFANSLIIEAGPAHDVQAIAAEFGWTITSMEDLPGYYTADTKDTDFLTVVNAANQLTEAGRVIYARPNFIREKEGQATPDDPKYRDQWHLNGSGSEVSHINLSPSVWDSYKGEGERIAIVDTGIDYNHEDITDNYRTDLDYDYVGTQSVDTRGNVSLSGPDDDPFWEDDEYHATFVAGLAAARGFNGKGVTGIAPSAELVNFRILGGVFGSSDSDIGQALSQSANEIDTNKQIFVSNNSWGYPSLGARTSLSAIETAALTAGIGSGRNGLGIVYVFAAGNSGGQLDSSDYSPLQSTRYTINVAAMGRDNTKAVYSEEGFSIFCAAPGGGQSSAVVSDGGMVSTDISDEKGYSGGNYSRPSEELHGTSFASPVVAGACALILDANPSLTWRDVKHVLAHSCTKNDENDESWQTNSADMHFNPKYGFGRLNVDKAIALAEHWTPVPDGGEQVITSLVTENDKELPDAIVSGLLPGTAVQTTTLSGSSNFKVEHIELEITLTHANRGDLSLELTAPSGTKTVFESRGNDTFDDYNGAILTSNAHWNEDPNGLWTLTIYDNVKGDKGVLKEWRVTAYGYAAEYEVNGNHPPVITSSLDNIIVEEDTVSAPYDIMIKDPEDVFQKSENDLTIWATSENTEVLDETSFAFSGTGEKRTLVITPLPNAFTYTEPAAPEYIQATIYVSDGDHVVSSALNVAVTSSPDVPVAQNTYIAVLKDTKVQGNLSIIDVDLPGDSHVFTLYGTGSLGGVVSNVDAATGQFTYTPANGVTGSESFTFQVEDSTGRFSNTATATLVIVDDDINVGARPFIISNPIKEIATSGTWTYTAEVDVSLLANPVLAFSLLGTPPSTLNMTEITTTGVTLKWTSVAPANGGDNHVRCQLLVADQVTGTMSLQSIIITLTDLNPTLSSDSLFLQVNQ